MIVVAPNISLNESELKFTFICSPGPGGQNVNKVATAVQLRFDVVNSPSLPEDVRARLLALLANKITTQGELVIKATRHRTQERNKQDALNRLIEWLQQVAVPPRKRRKTRPTKSSMQKRLSNKKQQGMKKTLRRRGAGED